MGCLVRLDGSFIRGFCLFVCLFVCTYACMHVYTYARMHVFVYLCRCFVLHGCR
jgi:hypothetical protein